MNDYTMKINECPTTVERIELLSQLMDKAYALSRDCLINAQDELAMQMETLNELNEELIRIGQKLGCNDGT